MKHEKCVGAILFVLFLSIPAHAMFVKPNYVPADRLITNTKAFLEENPKSHEGYYTLARIHYLAFASKLGIVGVTKQKSPPRIAPDWLLDKFDATIHTRRQHAREVVLKARGYASPSDVPKEERPKLWEAVRKKEAELNNEGWQPESLDREQLMEHASAAATNFRKAIELDPENGLYHLGLASLFQQYRSFARKARITEHPKGLRTVTLATLWETYHSAYSLSIKNDLKLKHRPIPGIRSIVSYEAGRGYVTWALADPSLSKDEKKRVARVQKDLKRLRGLRSAGVVTPIVFSVQEHSSLTDLLEPDSQVSFDLDGDGSAEQWPWVKPTTGLLVWDPDKTGAITSGRQLFGSATWWLLFANGYFALDVLDDDRDGSLTGPELDGIAVWFDTNSNGRSEPGEVIRVQDAGVQLLRTRPTGRDHGAHMNKAGIILDNGRVLPTYDWIASPVEHAVTVPLSRDE